jgi:hypothetical protein
LSGWTSYQAEVTKFIDAGENVVGVVHEKVGVGDSGEFVERDLPAAAPRVISAPWRVGASA